MVLEHLRQKGIRVGLLSNWDPRLRQVLTGFDWAGFLDPVLISEEVGTEKPQPEIFRKAEQTGSWRAHECALIGDDPVSDRGGAEAAGWKWALVERPDRGLWDALAHLGL
jgi:putative hydrolase of the HAD superfamily